MKRLTHIRPGSAFKVGFVMYALLFGILGLLALLLTLLGVGALRDMLDIAGVGAGIAGALIGYVISVVLYGLAGGVFSVIAAAIYNVVAGWTGGLEIEVS
ncbi:MAG: hypothetical protein QHJ81_12560 [Anaerolineae bacterium]|nr:hypothetical protein [Anaerolineae bacterium]